MPKQKAVKVSSRGRKRQKIGDKTNDVVIENDSSVIVSDLDESTVTNESLNILEDEDSEVVVKTPGKPGRKGDGQTTKMIDTLFTNCMHCFSAVDVETLPEIDPKIEVICAVCKTAIKNTAWNYHKLREHNQLAWQLDAPPLDLTDKQFVIKTLNTICKRKKSLRCQYCKALKRSTVGFLSHLMQCAPAETNKSFNACEFCNKQMLPVSLPTHYKACEKHPMFQTKRDASITEEFYRIVNNSTSIRAAAVKAKQRISNVANVIQGEYFSRTLNVDDDFVLNILRNQLDTKRKVICNFENCTFETSDLTDLLDHLKACLQRPTVEYFVCNECLYICKDLPKIKEHLKLVHALFSVHQKTNDDGDYDHVLDEMNEKCSSFGYHYADCQYKNRMYTFKWMQQFCKENYHTINFTDLPLSRCTLSLIDNLKMYFPRISHSIEAAFVRYAKYLEAPETNAYLTHSFQRFEYLQSVQYAPGSVAVFFGGSINAISWLPTVYNPQKAADQILAVATRNAANTKYLLSKNYNEKSIIFLWNFGSLTNSQQSLKNTQICSELLAGLLYDSGPVRFLEWCPSGGYSQSQNRLGILAVISSDVAVDIFSVPIFHSKHLYHTIQPIIKLIVHRKNSTGLGNVTFSPTCASWTKLAGHQYIAVGYSNGIAAIFDLKTKSEMLTFKRNTSNIRYILPVTYFHAHTNSITALVLHYANGGRQWLVTSSINRNVHFWNLNNVNSPYYTIKSTTITDFVLLEPWMSCLIAVDELNGKKYVCTSIKHHQKYDTENVSLLLGASAVSAVSFNSWLNCCLHGNIAGEVSGLFQLRLLPIPKRINKHRVMCSYVHLISKSKDLNSDNGHNLNYRTSDDKYALLFCDNYTQLYSTPSKASEAHSGPSAYSAVSPDSYPIKAVNKLAFNPNLQACMYYSIGYESGFVKLCYTHCVQEPNIS